MTREEAITYGERKKARIQEKLCRDGSSHGDYSIYYSEAEFTSAALSAFREQEERERGCEYCNGCKSVCNNDESIYITGNTLQIDIGCYAYSSAKINFCPMCGRRLYLPKLTTQKPNS